MGRLFTSGFELNSTTNGMEFDTWTGVGDPGISIQGTTKRNGSYGLKVKPNNVAASCLVTVSAIAAGETYYGRFYFNITTTPTNAIIFEFTDSTASFGIAIQVLAGPVLKLYKVDGGAQIGSNSAALSTGTWYRVEWSYAYDSGTATMRVDGVSTSGAATASKALQNAVYGCIGAGISVGEYYIDDVAINDSVGSYQASYPGVGNVLVLRPSGTGDSAAWTRAGTDSGANWSQCNNTPPNDATSYVSTTTANALDMYAIADSGLSSGATISVVEGGCRYSCSTTTSPTFKLRCIKTTGGTETLSAGIQPTSTSWFTNANAAPRISPLVMYTDPDGSAWTQATIDTMQLGMRETTDTNRSVYVSDIWVIVDWYIDTTKALSGAASAVASPLMTGMKMRQKFGAVTASTVSTVSTTPLHLRLRLGGVVSALSSIVSNLTDIIPLVIRYISGAVAALCVSGGGGTSDPEAWPAGVPYTYRWNFAGDFTEVNGNANLTQSGTLVFTTDKWGRSGQAVLRDASNTGSAYVSSNAILDNPGSQFSILVDINPATIAGGVVWLGHTYSTAYGWDVVCNGDGSVALETRDGAYNAKSSSAGLVATGNYYQLIITFDNGTVSFYKNGSLDSAPTGGHTPANVGGNLFWNCPASQFGGYEAMDRVVFYQGVWTQANVTSISNAWTLTSTTGGLPLRLIFRLAAIISTATSVVMNLLRLGKDYFSGAVAATTSAVGNIHLRARLGALTVGAVSSVAGAFGASLKLIIRFVLLRVDSVATVGTVPVRLVHRLGTVAVSCATSVSSVIHLLMKLGTLAINAASTVSTKLRLLFRASASVSAATSVSVPLRLWQKLGALFVGASGAVSTNLTDIAAAVIRAFSGAVSAVAAVSTRLALRMKLGALFVGVGSAVAANLTDIAAVVTKALAGAVVAVSAASAPLLIRMKLGSIAVAVTTTVSSVYLHLQLRLTALLVSTASAVASTPLRLRMKLGALAVAMVSSVSTVRLLLRTKLGSLAVAAVSTVSLQRLLLRLRLSASVAATTTVSTALRMVMRLGAIFVGVGSSVVGNLLGAGVKLLTGVVAATTAASTLSLHLRLRMAALSVAAATTVVNSGLHLRMGLSLAISAITSVLLNVTDIPLVAEAVKQGRRFIGGMYTLIIRAKDRLDEEV